MKLATVLKQAVDQLSISSPSPHLDAELLLSFTLKQSRSFLFAHPEYELSKLEVESFEDYLQQKCTKKPIAYITGVCEFWSLPFQVNEKVLIPRPETELLVEYALTYLPKEKQLIAELGTGSGAIICALAKERSHWQCYATDIDLEALNVAKHNAKLLKLSNITFHQGHWCEALPTMKFDAIISNPPYIKENDPDLEISVKQFEPMAALIAADNGLAAIKLIAKEAKSYLKAQGLFILEHGYQQGNAVRQILKAHHYQEINCHKDLAGHDRMTTAVSI